MKLKFINLLLASVLLVGSAQIFTSCKDNEADLYVNLKDQNIGLDKRLSQLETVDIPQLTTKIQDEITDRQAADLALSQQVDSKIQGLDAAIQGLDAAIQGIQGAGGSVDQLQQEVQQAAVDAAQAIQNAATNAAAIETLQQTVETLSGLETDLKSYIDQQDQDILTKVVAVEQKLTMVERTLNTVISDVQNITTNIIPAVEKKADDALALANANQTALTALETRVKALEDMEVVTPEALKEIKDQLPNFATKEELKNEVAALQKTAAENLAEAKKYTDDAVAALKTTVDANTASIGQLRQDMENAVNDLKAKYSTLETKVNENALAISNISQTIGLLNNRIEEVAGRVNGLILQQTDNAVFGTFNLPCGINSMMLVGWWGEVVNKDGLEFPTADAAYGYLIGPDFGEEGYYKYIGLTEDDIARIGVKPEKVTDRYLMARNEDGKGILGTVYMTVNPSNASLEGKTFNIVNSLGKALPVEIKPVPSNKELKFGYTRGGTANGFYEAQALINVDEATLKQLRVTLNPNLKNTVKNIINEGRDAINVNTIAKLGDAIYDQLNGILPALAISCSWNDSETGAMQVNTNYGLATAAIHARNFFFFTNLDGKLTTLPNLPNYSELKERFDAWFDEVAGKVVIKLNTGDFNINLGKIDVNIKKPTVTVNVSKGITADINATAKKDVLSFNITIDGEDEEAVAKDVEIPVTGKVTITPKDMEDFVKDIEASIKAALDDSMDQLAEDFTGSINEQLQNVANKIADSVKDLFGTMETNINGQIKDVLNYIQSTVDGKIDALGDRFSNLYNKVEDMIGRLNDVLTEPSHYVQPVLLYNSDSKIGLLSTDAYHPNVFKTSSAEAAVALIPTTYTLETIVPVYQKYVAVTNVWKNGQVGGATQTDVLKDANSEGYMNTVCPAQRHTVALKLKKGYTYEIVYQAMDYDGYVSGSKYYVTVK